MKPIVTARTNLVVTGPPGVGDLHAERVTDPAGIPGIRTIWTLSDQERLLVERGRNLELTFWGVVPPTSLVLAGEDDIGVGEDDPDKLARLEHYQP